MSLRRDNKNGNVWVYPFRHGYRVYFRMRDVNGCLKLSGTKTFDTISEAEICAANIRCELVKRGEIPDQLFATTREENVEIYFIQVGDAGPIKIGYSASAKKRLAALQTGHPDRLRLLAVISGERSIEAELHDRFAVYRKNGEWFEPHSDILDFIKLGNK